MNTVGKIVGSRNDIANAAIRSRSLMNSASPGTMTQSTCSPAYASKGIAQLFRRANVERHKPDAQCLRRRLCIAPLRRIRRAFHVSK
jgi:hypothetical protein